ncbi:3827_t:CDS:1, partial [Racocetra fulgida]
SLDCFEEYHQSKNKVQVVKYSIIAMLLRTGENIRYLQIEEINNKSEEITNVR